MLELLQKNNPDLQINSVFDESFKTYGNIVQEDVKELLKYASENITPPKLGTQYYASVEEIEKLETIKRISKHVYGYMDIEAGTVSGFNYELNGIEYHQGSETIIAVTDFVLIVGHRWDMKDNMYDLSLCESFYVPSGTIVECYSTTLHYTPCCINEKPLITICILLKGTGDILDAGRLDILKRKNKWFIAHPNNTEKVQSGDFPGLCGNVITIKY